MFVYVAVFNYHSYIKKTTQNSFYLKVLTISIKFSNQIPIWQDLQYLSTPNLYSASCDRYYSLRKHHIKPPACYRPLISNGIPIAPLDQVQFVLSKTNDGFMIHVPIRIIFSFVMPILLWFLCTLINSHQSWVNTLFLNYKMIYSRTQVQHNIPIFDAFYFYIGNL